MDLWLPPQQEGKDHGFPPSSETVLMRDQSVFHWTLFHYRSPQNQIRVRANATLSQVLAHHHPLNRFFWLQPVTPGAAGCFHLSSQRRLCCHRCVNITLLHSWGYSFTYTAVRHHRLPPLLWSSCCCTQT